MRQKFTALLTGLLLVASVAWAMEGALTYFQATSTGSAVKLDWELSNENGINSFELSRKTGTEPVFKKVTTIAPNGSRRYTYLDTEVTPDFSSNGAITYKLTLNTSGTDVSHYTTLSQSPSSVQRSWGSIKSMFR